MHLFFAYAREIKIINGKRRIEWFTFEEKALNAAVTAMINDLMERIHAIGVESGVQKPVISYDLGIFCEEVCSKVG